MRLPGPGGVPILVALACLALMAGSAWSGSRPLAIGIAVAQSGDIAAAGQEQMLGAQIAEEVVNRRGGVGGRPIKLVFQDAGSDEASAISAFQHLTTVAKVVGILGPSLSQQAFAAGPIANRLGVPVIGPSTTAKGIPQIGEFISRVSAPVAMMAPTVIRAALAVDPKLRRTAVLYAGNDAFSRSEAEAFQAAIKETLRLEPVAVERYQTTDRDFTAPIRSVQRARPDLVVVAGLQADGAAMVRQLRDLGYRGLIVGGNGLNTTNILSMCKAQCDGILFAQAYNPELRSRINDAFRSVYQEKQRRDPSQLSAQAFTGVQVFAEALSALDRKAPIAGMELATLRIELNKQILAGTYDTPLGEISFTPSPGGEVSQRQFYVAQVKMDPDGASGRFVVVK